jgi:tetratricopeptide (TPR) repeat protein
MSDAPQSTEAVKVFYSYSHKDERLRDTLEEHLSQLKRDGVISEWHDRGISAGREWAGEVDEHLKSADIILLLISSSFIASDYCYDVELKLAMERHEAGDARVVPVILRPCKWENAPFGKLNAMPKNAKPVTKWSNRDDAFTDIADGIGRVAEELKENRRASAASAAAVENAQPPAASRPAASLIPRPPSIGFVGRRDEQGTEIFAILKNALAPGKSQLVAVSGPGGTGKTTLAAEVARALRDNFRQRLAWVSALGRTDFGLQTLLDDIATQLGRADLRRLAPDQKAEQVRALLADAPSLVVLDNFETIEPGEQTRCVCFLAESTECSALITTRSRVNRADVRNIRLAAMEMDDAREFWRRLVEQSGRPEAFDGLDADDIIRHCEANPLVIQWVVGQIEQAQRPQDALDYLSQGHGDAAERVFDRSFNLPQLGDDGRAALLALSLFTPDASRESLAEVAGFGDDLNRLNQAVRKMSALWLVETTEGHERLFLRALKYEMAKARLSKDAHADEFRRRYVEHFLRYAKAHRQPTPENFATLDAEKDNLLGAMDMAFKARDWESVMRIRGAIDRFIFLRGYWDEAVRTGELAESAAHQVKDDMEVAHFIGNVAMIFLNRGQYEKARSAYQEALNIARNKNSETNVAVCLHQLGRIAQEQRDFQEAGRLYEESLEIKVKLHDLHGVAGTMGQIGTLLMGQGKTEESKIKHEESLSIRRQIGDQLGIAIDLHQLGRVAVGQGKLNEARRLYDESLEILKKLGDKRGIAIVLYNLGIVVEKEGDNVEASRFFREALFIFSGLGSPLAETVRNDLARVERVSG